MHHILLLVVVAFCLRVRVALYFLLPFIHIQLLNLFFQAGKQPLVVHSPITTLLASVYLYVRRKKEKWLECRRPSVVC